MLNWLTWAYLAWKRFLDEDLCVWKVCSVSADDLLPPTAPPALEWSALRNWMPNSYRKFSKVKCPQKSSRTSSTVFAPIKYFSCLSKSNVFLDENLQKWPLWAIRNSKYLIDRMSGFYKYRILFAVIHGLQVTNPIILERISDHILDAWERGVS